MRKGYAIVIIFALVVGYYLVASFGPSEPLASRIAEDPSVKGKGKDIAGDDRTLNKDFPIQVGLG